MSIKKAPPKTNDSSNEKDKYLQLNDEILKELDLKLTDELKKELQQSKAKLKNSTEYEKLLHIVSEYLKCFIIIGYDINGQQILIGQAKNPQEYNSLVEHLRQTFIRTMNSIS